jgi:hypothetical protein
MIKGTLKEIDNERHDKISELIDDEHIRDEEELKETDDNISKVELEESSSSLSRLKGGWWITAALIVLFVIVFGASIYCVLALN